MTKRSGRNHSAAFKAGYDLVITLSSTMETFGLVIPAGTGFVENPDGTWQDANGNTVPPPVDSNFGTVPSTDPFPPYTFYDPYGDCLIGLECLG